MSGSLPEFPAPTTPKEAFGLAIELAGGQSAFARLCGGKVRQGHVWAWLNKSGELPPEFCRPVEAALNGRVTRYQLRPDVFGHSEDGVAA